MELCSVRILVTDPASQGGIQIDPASTELCSVRILV